MQIKKLIKIYEDLIPLYEIETRQLSSYTLRRGICNTARYNLKYLISNIEDLVEVFTPSDYYRNYTRLAGYNHYLKGPKPGSWAGHKFRLEFMKKEIPELKALLEQGYTHV